MHVVAIASFGTSSESEAEAIAAILGITVYDVRVVMAHPLPRIVFRSPTYDTALDVLGQLQARGHGVLACDTDEVLPRAAMVRVRRFAFDDTVLRANDPEGNELAWPDIAAIVHVAMRTSVARTKVSKELVSRGPRPAPTLDVEHTSTEHVVEHAIHLFSKERGVRPWVMAASDAQYLGLGRRMRLTKRENFLETIALLRERATQAVYDDRYANEPILTRDLLRVRDHDPATPSSGDASVDLSVHLLAEWLLRPKGSPYRNAP